MSVVEWVGEKVFGNVGKKSAIIAANGARDGGRFIRDGLAVAGQNVGSGLSYAGYGVSRAGSSIGGGFTDMSHGMRDAGRSLHYGLDSVGGGIRSAGSDVGDGLSDVARAADGVAMSVRHLGHDVRAGMGDIRNGVIVGSQNLANGVVVGTQNLANGGVLMAENGVVMAQEVHHGMFALLVGAMHIFRDMGIKLGLLVIAWTVLNHLFATGHSWCGMAFAVGIVLFFGAHGFTFPFVDVLVRYAVWQTMLWTAALVRFLRRNKAIIFTTTIIFLMLGLASYLRPNACRYYYYRCIREFRYYARVLFYHASRRFAWKIIAWNLSSVAACIVGFFVMLCAFRRGNLAGKFIGATTNVLNYCSGAIRHRYFAWKLLTIALCCVCIYVVCFYDARKLRSFLPRFKRRSM